MLQERGEDLSSEYGAEPSAMAWWQDHLAEEEEEADAVRAAETGPPKPPDPLPVRVCA